MLTKREFEQIFAAMRTMEQTCSSVVEVKASDVLGLLAEFTDPKPSTKVWLTKAPTEGFVNTNWHIEWPKEGRQ